MIEGNLVNQQFGSYILLELINRGAFGSVFKARHQIFEDEPIVAVKIMHSRFSRQDELDFIQEARLLKKLKHPHILSIIDAGIQHGVPYIVTEYAAGGSLRDHIAQQAGRPLPTEKALRILKQIGEALHFAHEHHIVHRDLKPDNILFNAAGDALLADFGIAAILNTLRTRKVDHTGTPAYMAPEQFEGLVSAKSDQYALGCIAYELLSGRRPYTPADGNWSAWHYQHAQVEPAALSASNPHLPAPIEVAIRTAMAKDRTMRYDTVAAFVSALQETGVQKTVTQKTAKQWKSEGDAFYNQKRYQEALAAFEQALHLDPTPVYAYYGKGIALRDLRRYDEALAAFEQALHLDPTSVYAYNGKGITLRNLRRYDEALAAYEQALHLDPTFAAAYYNKGIALHDLQRYDEALAAYEQAIRFDPTFAAAYYRKGVALSVLQRDREAQGAFEQARRLDPGLF